VLVLCVEIDAVRVDRLYPRALLTPFTDDVHLTGGDERVYADAARAQRAKGFQRVDVHFDAHERDSSAEGSPETDEPPGTATQPEIPDRR
jgi:hypothetical protein